jgi:hypothetical protein
VTERHPSQQKRLVFRAIGAGAASVALLFCSVACVRTTIRSGRAPGDVPPGWEDRWHHGFVFGLAELPGPVPLDALCPGGWSEVDTAIDPIQSVIALFTLGIYTPTTISVICAEPDLAKGREALGDAGTRRPPKTR